MLFQGHQQVIGGGYNERIKWGKRINNIAFPQLSKTLFLQHILYEYPNEIPTTKDALC